MPSATHLYSIDRCEADSDHWVAIAVGVSRRDFVARLRQDGIQPVSADRWAEQAALSAKPGHATTQYVVGDRHDYTEAGPRRESYRVLAIAVRAPEASQRVTAPSRVS